MKCFLLARFLLVGLFLCFASNLSSQVWYFSTKQLLQFGDSVYVKPFPEHRSDTLLDSFHNIQAYHAATFPESINLNDSQAFYSMSARGLLRNYEGELIDSAFIFHFGSSDTAFFLDSLTAYRIRNDFFAIIGQGPSSIPYFFKTSIKRFMEFNCTNVYLLNKYTFHRLANNVEDNILHYKMYLSKIEANDSGGRFRYKLTDGFEMPLITSEIFEIIPHSNGHAYWLTYVKNKDTFCAHYVDSNGFSSNPVYSIGTFPVLFLYNSNQNSYYCNNLAGKYYGPGFTENDRANFQNSAGLKFSNDRKAFVVWGYREDCQTANNPAMLYHFDPETGEITSNGGFYLLNQNDLGIGGITDAAFSPNDSIIYFVSSPYTTPNDSKLDNARIHQVKRYQPNQKYRVLDTRTNNYNGRKFYPCEMRLAPDQKIYLSSRNEQYYRFNYPDKWGDASGFNFFYSNDSFYRVNHTNYNQDNRHGVWAGLPHDVRGVRSLSYLLNSGTQCIDTAVFTWDGDESFNFVVWSWGDGRVDTLWGTEQLKKGTQLKHRYDSSGTYAVSIMGNSNDCVPNWYAKDTVVFKFNPAFVENSFLEESCAEALWYKELSDISLMDSLLFEKNHQTQSIHGSLTSWASDTFTVQDSTLFTVRLKNKDCTVEIRDTVQPLPLPIVQLQNDTVICEGETVILYSYLPDSLNHLWLPSNETSDSIVVDKDGLYTLEITNNHGCKSSDSVYVQVNPRVPAFFVLPSNVCKGDSFILYGLEPNSYDAIEWEWLVEGMTVSTNHQLQTTLENTSKIKHRMAYERSGLWCEQEDSIDFNIYPLPQAAFSLSDTGHCLKGNTFTATDQSTGTDGNSFWSSSDGQSGTNNSFEVNFTQTGSYSIKIFVESDRGCKDSLEKQVEVYPHPKAEFTLNEQAQCLENNHFEATLTSRDATNQTLHWGNGSIQDNAQNQTYKNTYTASGSYQIRLHTENEYGCTDTASQSITIHPQPEGSLDPVLVCEEMPVTLRSTNQSSFATHHRLLPNGTSYNLNAGASVLHEGETATLPSYTATLHMESTEGCIALLTKTFPVNKAPEPTFTWVADRHAGDLHFRFTGSQEGDWEAESGKSGSGIVWEVGFNDTGMILVTFRVVSGSGCEGEVSELIPVYEDIELYVPNAFSPNADGHNETWKPGNSQFIKEYHVRIWNHWGQMVHESTNPHQGWNGAKAQQGVYLFIINAKDIYGKNHNVKGTVHLVR